MTAARVDFATIKEHVTMEQLIEHYDLQGLRPSGAELRGPCPIHSAGGRTFHVHLGKNVFQCFSCKAHGNVLDFVAAMERCSVREAGEKLQEWYGNGTTDRHAESLSTQTPEQSSNNPLRFQLRTDPEHPYGRSRGLSLETLRAFGAGLCTSKGMFAGKFVVPLHNDQGELVGYAGRSTSGQDPKYFYPPEGKGFDKSRLVFNLHRLALDAAPARVVVAVGDPIVCMKLSQLGIASVGLLGPGASDEQAARLGRHFRSALVLQDQNGAASDAILALAAHLFVKTITGTEDTLVKQLTQKERGLVRRL